ncbi:response regulator transcription factor [Athalassotoga saccharophila]|uniref:response regulator transcription factor n=1 Tax=Athalassotoga saccharophila TaxID=1441386 RepID=UPI00137B0C36|nr:response regulator transcription factor [Athalassotoga saccharophila]
MERILIVEDDKSIGDILNLYLSKKYDTVLVNDGMEAARIIKKERFDLILLDLMLPNISGETLAQMADLSRIPVIIITAKSSEEDILNGLKLGVIDYITKPFSPKILLAKIDNFFSRMRNNVVDLGDDGRSLIIGGKKIYLTQVESKLLNFLIKNYGRVCKREELLMAVWNGERSERIVDATVKNLRKKIKDSGIEIKTVMGLGYTIEKSKTFD